MSQKIAHSKTTHFPRHFVFVLKLKIQSIWKQIVIYINEKKIYLGIFSFLFDQNRGNIKREMAENIKLCLSPQQKTSSTQTTLVFTDINHVRPLVVVLISMGNPQKQLVEPTLHCRIKVGVPSQYVVGVVHTLRQNNIFMECLIYFFIFMHSGDIPLLQ